MLCLFTLITFLTRLHFKPEDLCRCTIFATSILCDKRGIRVLTFLCSILCHVVFIVDHVVFRCMVCDRCHHASVLRSGMLWCSARAGFVDSCQ